jgi:putative Mg2+ transporter-C (MgtC) family protein
MPVDDQLAILGRLAFAVILGGLIGLERELRGYPAGIRTMALITMGSMLFTDVSQILGGDDRVAAGIVTGIGFLGAGVIFREQFTVRGITTAATIWASAAIGMAIGRELYLVAGLGTLLIFVVLEARPITRRVDDAIRRRTRELSEELEQAITSSHLDEIEQERDKDQDD